MTPRDFRSSGPGRLYALLVRMAYPPRFRARFEAEMTDAVEHDHEAARAKGAGATAAFWTRTAAEAVYFGTAERRGGGSVPGPKPSPWRTDWRDAYRSLRATPIVTIVAILSLALGIGATAALFSILNSLVYKTLPVKDPQQLVVIDEGTYTNPIWEQIRDRHVFDQALAWSSSRFNLADHGANDYVWGDYVSGSLFDVLGVHAVVGRTIMSTDDTHAGGTDGPVAVISYGLWQRRFGGSADAIGKSLTIDQLPFTVIGVTPPDFLGPDVGTRADVFVPIGTASMMPGRKRMIDGRSTWWLEIMARLSPGQSLAAAQSALRGVQPAVREATLPPNWPAREIERYLTDPFVLKPAATGESELRGSYATPLAIVLIIVGSVLVIACANIANLLLARATARQRELSLRLALGASRARVARQLIAESAMLAAGGALLGVLFARFASALLVRQLGPNVALDLSPDWRVLGFTTMVALATALLFGLAPAIGVARLEPNDALKSGGRSMAGDRHQRVRHALVVGQVALSLALVLGGALFVRTFAALTSVPLGFDAERLIVMDVNAARLDADQAPVRYAALRDRISQLPGVASAALSGVTPAGSSRWNTIIEPATGSLPAPDKQHEAWVNAVSPGYFRTYGTPLIQGRDFDEHDVAGAPLVTVVNEAFVHRFLTPVPVGAVVRTAADDNTVHEYRVVGVAGNSVYDSMREADNPIMYLSSGQTKTFATSMALTIRAAGDDPGPLMPVAAKLVTADLPEGTFTMWRLSDRLGTTVRQERLVALLAGFFGVLALVLAALGLYGVTAYSVNRRRNEIGIRMALGADRSGVIQLVVGRVVWLVAIGIATGAVLSYWAGQYVTKLLFNVHARDPLMFTIAAAVLMCSALLAGWLPARRAAALDPASVLRE